ncbi:MAG: dUTP diphosphatase [bacterium]
MDKVYFQKLKENAIIPSKKEENGGYDIYACIDKYDDYDQIVIKPGEIKMIPTGIATAFDKKYVALVRERGSTGKIGMEVRAGVVDSNYRGQWYIFITNGSNKEIIINNCFDEITEFEEEIYYPITKAIAQFIITNTYHLETEIVDDINVFESERGDGKLGSSGK